MEREEALKRVDHYRCRLCGHISPLTATQCAKSSCRAHLGLYGEIITGESDTFVSGENADDGSQPSQESVETGPTPEPAGTNRCMYCGAELTPGAEECPCCGLRIARASSGSSAGGSGTATIEDKNKKREVTRDKAEKTGASWKVATILTAFVSAVVIIILGVSLSQANADTDRWRNQNHNVEHDYDKLQGEYDTLQGEYDTLQSEYDRLQGRYDTLLIKYDMLQGKYDTLQSDYDALQDDYDALQDDYDTMRGIWELNNLGDLYTVKVTSVFNSDGDGKEIDKKLNVATMEHLAIGVKITAGADKNRWAENMTVKLKKSGNEIVFWTIKPNEHYDDGTKSCTWTMWTSNVETAGTYVAEFYHMGYLIARHEITVK